ARARLRHPQERRAHRPAGYARRRALRGRAGRLSPASPPARRAGREHRLRRQQRLLRPAQPPAAQRRFPDDGHCQRPHRRHHQSHRAGDPPGHPRRRRDDGQRRKLPHLDPRQPPRRRRTARTHAPPQPARVNRRTARVEPEMEEQHKFLDHDLIRSNLVLSALYLTAYEVLKGSIITNILDFFATEVGADGRSIPSEQYKIEVKEAHKDLLYASCLWLLRNEAITEQDVVDIRRIREHRNQVAHELPSILIEKDLNIEFGLFLRMRELLEKIEKWWVINVDIPANPDFDGKEVDEGEIQTGRVLIIDHVVSVVFGAAGNAER